MPFEYKIKVDESVQREPALDNIYATLIGVDGRSDKTKLNGFKLPWMTSTVTIETEQSLGEILLLKLERVASLISVVNTQWYCSYIEVTTPEEQNILFPCYKYIRRDKEVKLRGGNAVIKDTRPELIRQRKEELRERQRTFKFDEYLDGICDLSTFQTLSELPDELQFSYGRFITPSLITALKNLEIVCLKHLFTSTWINLEDMKTLSSVLKTDMSEYVAEHWKEDDFFGYQFLNGINPNVIKKYTEPLENFKVTDEMVKPFLEEGSSLQEEMKKGNIFIYDQSILDGIDGLKHNGEQLKMTAALCLFYKKPDGKLKPIAIQLHQQPSELNPIFLPSDSDTDWLLAKMFVKNGDTIMHESIYHLLQTHFLEESFAVATYRNFAAIHPIFKLLVPNFRSTFHINTLARSGLLGDGKVFNKSTIGHDGIRNLMKKGFSQMTYTTLCLPDNIKERQLDSIEGFYYRDDGVMLWKIISKFVENVMKLYYHKNEDVVEDAELQQWIQEIFTHTFLGKTDSGFPDKFETVEEVIKFITMVIFTATGQHSAVNNGQADFILTVANAPFLLEQPPPTTKGESSNQSILETLPNVKDTLEFSRMVVVLSQSYLDAVFLIERPNGWFQEPEVEYAFDEFWAGLKYLHHQIDARQNNGIPKYTYLDPVQTESSITI